MGLGWSGRRGRIALAVNLVLVVVVAGLAGLVLRAEGFRSHDARLNDGGIWVTNGRDGFYGRVNKPIGQLDDALFAAQGTTLDIVQDGPVVVGVDLSQGAIAPIDPSRVAFPEGEQAAVPGTADVQLAGGTLAVLDPVGGQLWAQRADAVSGVTVAPLDRQAPPLAKTGGAAALAVTRGGSVLVAAAGKDTLTTFEPEGAGFAEGRREALPSEVGEQVALTAVGETPVTLDAETGAVAVVGGGTADVEDAAVLQQAGPGSDQVLVATPTSLVAVDLDSGRTTTLAEGLSGEPTAPVRLGACSYGAWSGSNGWVVTVCGDDEPVVSRLSPAAEDLVFRVNRGEILLNDRATGTVWTVDTDRPAQIDNWDAFLGEHQEKSDEEEAELPQAGRRRPPQANPDSFGARPGRTTILHPLDNDAAVAGRILSIRSVTRVSNPDAQVTISPDGQTLQLWLPEDAAGPTTFEYFVDDGRQDVSAHAAVRVAARPATANAPPHFRPGFQPRTWTVPAGGQLDVPVLPDWRDRRDGDPLTIETATAVGGQTSGASARVTADRRIRFTAPAESGEVTVEYTVVDGAGAARTQELAFRVQDRKDREAVAAVAEPDVVAGEVGQPIVVRPLANDLPGSDPTTLDATLTLAGRLAEPQGATVQTDLVKGAVVLRSTVPSTYFLDYEAAYGNAPLAKGRIRVDVRPPARTPPDPVAMPDTVTVYGQAATLVDVLANDIDPAGGLLAVTGSTADSSGRFDVTVVGNRWLRIAARQGRAGPVAAVVRYSVSNGPGQVDGDVVVNQKPAPADNTPVTAVDRVVVRAGASAAIPVLDNDFSPSGEALALVPHVSGEDSGQLTVQRPGDEKVPTGEAFVTGRFVRYVAPTDLEDSQTFTVRYLAQNTAGDSAPGRAEITVVPAGASNRPPEPPVVEGRAAAGSTIKLRLPTSGVDPDGDPVTLVGLDSAPKLGRVVASGANSLHYEAYPGSTGTDEFGYAVTDAHGETESGVVRVLVVPSGKPEVPVAVPDTVTVEPGRTALVDALANDLRSPGDRVTLSLVDPPPGVTLRSETGPVEIEAPDEVDGRNVEVVYSVSNGIDTSLGLVTLRTAESFNNPPVVFDAFGATGTGSRVSVDVLASAYDPDDPEGALRVTDAWAPRGVTADTDGSRLTVERAAQPIVVPFRVEDGDGGATTASLYVPAAGAGVPHARPDATIAVPATGTVSANLADLVVNPAGGRTIITLKDRIWASPVSAVSAEVTGPGTIELSGDGTYEGPAAVVFEVTTGETVDDPDGVRALVSVPVQVGRTRPILRCPSEPVELVQGESVELDVASLCRVWTPERGQAGQLDYAATWQGAVPGLGVEAGSSAVGVSAASSAKPGTEAVLELSAGGSQPSELNIRVVAAPPPTLAPIRIADMKAGQERTVNLAKYLRPGVSNPEPRVLSVSQLTKLDAQVSREEGSTVRISTGSHVDGRALFRVVMSDVEGEAGPERRAEGLVALEILDRPDTPRPPVPGRTVRSQEVLLSWRAPDANGSPIDGYQLRASNGAVRHCGTTTCDFTGLVNGRPYAFQVRAHNALGWSAWSRASVRAVPDARPGLVGPIRLVGRPGDRTLTFRWSAPTKKTSAIRRYHVSWPGGHRTVSGTRVTVGGLNNNRAYTFVVAAENALDVGPGRRSAAYQSVGVPGAPRAPRITHHETSGSRGAVTVAWPAVNPNGPRPVRYTVYRNGRPLGNCTRTTRTSCYNGSITYNGAKYTYAVRAVNGGGKAARGPGRSWAAVGRPASWGSWSIRATGNNNRADMRYTVPSSRGAGSRVRIYVNGRVVSDRPRRGGEHHVIATPSNNRSYPVRIRVCNEKGACSWSSTKHVQSYGPLVRGHINQIDPNRGGGRIWWRIQVDANGNAARVKVCRRRVFADGSQSACSMSYHHASGVDKNVIRLGSRSIARGRRERVQVWLYDTSPRRATVTRTRTSG